MWKTTLAGLRAHKLRLVATGLAIILGVGFVAGTLIFSDTAKAALYDQFARAAENVDVSVLGAPNGDTMLPRSTVDTIGKVPGVGSVDGRMRQPLPLLDKKGKLVTSGTEPGLTLSAGTVTALRPYDLVAGDAPTGPTRPRSTGTRLPVPAMSSATRSRCWTSGGKSTGSCSSAWSASAPPSSTPGRPW
jgi:putative ABC transport system permease protein